MTVIRKGAIRTQVQALTVVAGMIAPPPTAGDVEIAADAIVSPGVAGCAVFRILALGAVIVIARWKTTCSATENHSIYTMTESVDFHMKIEAAIITCITNLAGEIADAAALSVLTRGRAA